MEVILLERIERLGQMGDVVKVKPGFARNYLLPQKKALRATEENKRFFESRRTELEATNLKRRQEAEAVAKKMEGVSLTLIRQAGESGQLYGSVTARDIAVALTEAGYHVERGQIQIGQPIKILGIHTEHVALHPEVSVEITLNVAQSEEAAAIQASRGGSAAQLAEREASAQPQATAPATRIARVQEAEESDESQPESGDEAPEHAGDGESESQ